VEVSTKDMCLDTAQKVSLQPNLVAALHSCLLDVLVFCMQKTCISLLWC
jgi:hypothetical protein